MSANELAVFCEVGSSSKTKSGEIACFMYVKGVMDGSLWGSAQRDVMAGRSTPSQKEAFCIPDGATGSQMTDVVRKYLVDHPAQRHHAAAIVVLESLREAFPCRK